MPDCVSLVWYRTCSSIVSFFQSGTGLTTCQTVQHFYIYVPWLWHEHAALTWTCNMDMDLQYGHGHAAWTWTRNTASVMQHGSGQWTCMDAGMPIKSSVQPCYFSVSLQCLVWHRHSGGIMVSLVLLVTDESVSAQLCCRGSYEHH